VFVLRYASRLGCSALKEEWKARRVDKQQARSRPAKVERSLPQEAWRPVERTFTGSEVKHPKVICHLQLADCLLTSVIDSRELDATQPSSARRGSSCTVVLVVSG